MARIQSQSFGADARARAGRNERRASLQYKKMQWIMNHDQTKKKGLEATVEQESQVTKTSGPIASFRKSQGTA